MSVEISYDSLRASSTGYGGPLGETFPVEYESFAGDSYPGGYGITKLLVEDRYTMILRSDELFGRNPFARSLVRKLAAFILHNGLELEAEPEAEILGMTEDEAEMWSDGVELLYNFYSNDAQSVDFSGQKKRQQIAMELKTDALIQGDMLVILRYNKGDLLPKVQIISGYWVQTPPMIPKNPDTNYDIVDGVEVNEVGAQVAYWVYNPKTYEHDRIAAYGQKSNQRIAWLYYGERPRVERHRGTPILGVFAQMLKELDELQSAELTSALTNAFLAMYVTRDVDKPASNALSASGGVVRTTRQNVLANDHDGSQTTGQYVRREVQPGMVVQHLQVGEDIKSFDTARPNVNFAAFRDAILQVLAWASDIPPTVLREAFSSNYSASSAEIVLFKYHMEVKQREHVEGFELPLYTMVLVGMVGQGRVPAPGFAESLRRPASFDIRQAWLSASFVGAEMSPVRPDEEVKGELEKIAMGASTFQKASRKLGGGSFSRNAKKLTREWQKFGAILQNVQMIKGGANAGTMGDGADKPEKSKGANKDAA